jgi:hypothetical protein
MACVTTIAPSLAMATTQFKQGICHGTLFPYRTERNGEPKIPRMNWVVVTDKTGNRHLRIHWMTDESRESV